jgi:hypothetical protein
MKSFKTYLTESVRTYDFRVRIAGDVTTEAIAKMKSALELYKMESMSKPKRLPVQETHLFPNMGPVEVNVIDVSVAYPCNDDQIRNALAACGFAASCIRVNGKGGAFEAILDGTEVSNKNGKKGEAVLNQTEMKAEPVPEDLVGDARIPSLIKELAATRKYEYPASGK